MKKGDQEVPSKARCLIRHLTSGMKRMIHRKDRQESRRKLRELGKVNGILE